MPGYLAEVFESIQGEGLRLGCAMTFIRFLGCNLACAYCDTTFCRRRRPYFQYKRKKQSNPVEPEFLLNLIEGDEVALTGGEPLLQADFAAALAAAIRKTNRLVYLETNGTLPDALAKVIGFVDWVAMDIKIPSATGGPAYWHEAGKFLKIAAQRNVFIKAVMDDRVEPDELDSICSVIEAVDRRLTLILQPVFGHPWKLLLDHQKTLKRRLTDVRIIPQQHKYLNLR